MEVYLLGKLERVLGVGKGKRGSLVDGLDREWDCEGLEVFWGFGRWGWSEFWWFREAIDRLELKRYCCRRMILTHVDLIVKLLSYNISKYLDMNAFFKNKFLLKVKQTPS